MAITPRPGDPLLDAAEAAEYLDVKHMTLLGYLKEARVRRRANQELVGDFPEPDNYAGQSPQWYQSTIDRYVAERPGRGVRRQVRKEPAP